MGKETKLKVFGGHDFPKDEICLIKASMTVVLVTHSDSTVCWEFISSNSSSFTLEE